MVSRVLQVVAAGFLLGAAARGFSREENLPYRNAQLPVSVRVDDLVARMTLEEEVSQMQNHAAAIPRLGIPEYNWWNEALHGVASSGYATVFPQSIGLAATWDESLLRQVAHVTGVEGRAKYTEAQKAGNRGIFYGLTLWAPNINIFRDPRWGRGQETYGEDPYLAGRMAVSFVKGLQGEDSKYFLAVATPKHFAVHSGPEQDRHRFNATPSAHDLEDTYLPAFRAAVTAGHAESIMCAYNDLYGEPACANSMLLQQTLRRDWGFDGYVVSDDGAIQDIVVGHKAAPDMEHAAADAVRAGTDLDCGSEYENLVRAVKDGLISKEQIDTSVKRLMEARIRLGMFDPPILVPYSRIQPRENNTAGHRMLALQAARESMVLLKNDGVLPLTRQVHTVAVIGPNSASLSSLEGSY